MKLIKASEVKRKQMYSESYIANEISLAMHRRRTNISLNADLMEDSEIEILNVLGYDIRNNSGKIEISWQYAK
jgi:hypothetical protein